MVHRNKSSMDYVSLGCCALAFVLYLNTLNAGFVYDDRRAILGNPDVLSSTPLFQLLFNDFWGTPLIDSGSHGSYRPLCVLSFKLNHMVGGFKPMGYHLVNVLLHCLATGLVVKLARNILPYGYGTLISGLLFASHPIHTEAVAGIVGRADLIACNLYLLTLLSYIKHVQWREKCDLKHWLALIAAIVFASAAILCKETAITALAVCIIYDIIRGLNSYTRDKLRLRSIGVLCIALSTTLHLRLSIPGPTTQFSTADNPVAKANSLLTRFFTFTYLPVFNFKLLVYPETLSFDWGMDAIPRIASLFESRNFISLTFYLSLGQILMKNINFLRKTIPKLMNSKRIGRSINKKKYHNQQNQKQRQQDDYHQQEHDNYCIVCKQQMIRHSSACRALNNNNNNNSQASVIACGCPQKINKFISLSPLKQYISTNSTYLNNNTNNNSYNNNTSVANANANSNQHISEFLKDNNNNYSVIINNNTTNNNNNNSYLNHNLYPITKNGVKNKLLSISVAKCEKTENSLNSASAILISITILTLPFLPAANIFFYVGFVVAERILYLPSVGYCLLIGLSLGKFINFNTNCKPIKSKLQNKSYKCEKINKFNVKSIVTILLLIILISVYSVKTIRRNMDWRDEESLYRSAVTVNPPKALGNLGSVLSSQGRYEEAKAALLEALKHRPNMADVHYNLGVLYQNQQNYEEAVECFQKAIHFRPSLALAYLNLGTSLISLGRCNEAASILRDATKLDGSGLRDRMAHENARISSLLQLGGLYADQGKLQRALAVYREALHTLPKNYPPQGIYHRLGDVFAKLQQWNEAERFQRATLEVQPDHIAAHISYGTMLARNSSRSSEAEQYFKRAIRLAPLDPSVHHHYAEFLQSLSRHEEACDSRVRAAELAPDDYSLVVTAATALRMLDRKVEAEKWYRQAVTLKPDDARAHTNLGAILHLLGRTHQAAVSYKNALKLQPGDPTTLGNLEKLGIAEIS